VASGTRTGAAAPVVELLSQVYLYGGREPCTGDSPPYRYLVRLLHVRCPGKLVSTGHDSERRTHRRIRGPFDAVRMGLLEFKLRIYDLSAGGCLIESLAEITPGHPIRLRIALPDGDSVTVRGHVTRPLPDMGFAIRFVDLDAATRARIERALDDAQLERAQN
jgi:hypothetical protein